jgi:predicted amidohydrolase
LIAASAFAVDFLVKTDAEKVRTVLRAAAKAVEKEDVEAMKQFFSDGYRDSFHPSRESLLNNCRFWLTQQVIEKNVLRIVSLKVEPPNAEAVFTVRVVFDPKGPVFEYRKLMVFKLRADFRKEGGAWYFGRVEVLEIDFQPAGWQQIQGIGGEIF